MKKTEFHSLARATIREFSEEVRRELGEAITDLQKGFLLGLPISRPIPSKPPQQEIDLGEQRLKEMLHD